MNDRVIFIAQKAAEESYEETLHYFCGEFFSNKKNYKCAVQEYIKELTRLFTEDI